MDNFKINGLRLLAVVSAYIDEGNSTDCRGKVMHGQSVIKYRTWINSVLQSNDLPTDHGL